MEMLQVCKHCSEGSRSLDSQEVHQLCKCGRFLLCNSIQDIQECPFCLVSVDFSVLSQNILVIDEMQQQSFPFTTFLESRQRYIYSKLKSPIDAYMQFVNQKFTQLDPTFRYIYFHIDFKRSIQEIIRFIKYLFEYNTQLCLGCGNQEAKFVDFLSRSFFCNECRDNSSIPINCSGFSDAMKKLLRTQYENCSPCLYAKDIKNTPQSVLKNFMTIALRIDLGRDVKFFCKKCPKCLRKFDYKQRIPLTFDCLVNQKHFFCSQCFYQGSKCPFDMNPVRNVRLFVGVLDGIKCVYSCGYTGRKFYRIKKCKMVVCEKCYNECRVVRYSRIIATELKVCREIEMCLDYFTLSCRKHNLIAEYWNQHKFEVYCIECSEDDKERIDIKSLAEEIYQKKLRIAGMDLKGREKSVRKAISSNQLYIFERLNSQYWRLKDIEHML